jgi:hypothetical protein
MADCSAERTNTAATFGICDLARYNGGAPCSEVTAMPDNLKRSHTAAGGVAAPRAKAKDRKPALCAYWPTLSVDSRYRVKPWKSGPA